MNKIIPQTNEISNTQTALQPDPTESSATPHFTLDCSNVSQGERPSASVQAAPPERITRSELRRRQEADAQAELECQREQDEPSFSSDPDPAPAAAVSLDPTHAHFNGGGGFDLHFILDRMPAVLNEVRRSGHDVTAECPECHHVGRAGYARSFFSTPKTGYSYWTCRHCDHRATTRSLLGLSWTAQPRPSVKEWKETGPVDADVAIIREIYKSLTEYALIQASRSNRFKKYIKGRGVSLDHATTEQLGYIDWPSYRRWFATLSFEHQEAAVSLAGLPDGRNERAYGFARKFAGGNQGKIVFSYCNERGEVVDLRTRSISSCDNVGYTSPARSYDNRGVDVPYGVANLDGHNRIVLTEGEFKRLVPMSKGCDLPIVALRGTSDRVDVYLPHFRNKLVILAFDNDDTPSEHNGLTPGQLATIRIGRQLRAHHIDVMVLNPALLRNQKGLDDFVNTYGIHEFNKLLRPSCLSTLTEFEKAMRQNGAKLKKIAQPRGDIGTVRQWTPDEFVSTFAHQGIETVTLETAESQIYDAATNYLETWEPGDPPLMITASPGVGKTTIVSKAGATWAERNKKRISFIFPNHNTIDEKLAEVDHNGDPVLPPGTMHIYGHRDDEEIELCRQSEVATTLISHGYDASRTVCPSCPFLGWCKKQGYKAQFNRRQHRAYVHAHIFTNYPGDKAEAVVIDELTHKQFIETTTIGLYDILNVVQSGKIESGEQLDLLHAFTQMLNVSAHGDLSGQEFYNVLERYYPALRTSDKWHKSLDINVALDKIAQDYMRFPEEIALPYRFARALLAVLFNDVERLSRGENVSGRIRIATVGSKRVIELDTSRNLPKWWNEVPIIILNATADEELMKSIVGPLHVVKPQVQIRSGNTIVQDITRNHSMSSLVGNGDQAQHAREDLFSDIQKLIDTHPDGETDTTIFAAKAVTPYLKKRFPDAKIAHYHALEGRNDLQAGLTILATPPPISLDAIRREAAALWPGVDTSLLRHIVAFDQTNANGEFLTVEQLDALDPRVQALIWQHRDAAAIQAVHRARLVRQTGRTVAILFSRPIPGIVPTKIVTERESPAKRAATKAEQTIKRLTHAAIEKIESGVGFTLSMLTDLVQSGRNTVKKYWEQITGELGLNWFDMPVLQPLANGVEKAVTMRMAFSPTVMMQAQGQVDVGNAPNLFEALSDTIHQLLPDGWQINRVELGLDPETPPVEDPRSHGRSTTNNIDPISDGSPVRSCDPSDPERSHEMPDPTPDYAPEPPEWLVDESEIVPEVPEWLADTPEFAPEVTQSEPVLPGSASQDPNSTPEPQLTAPQSGLSAYLDRILNAVELEQALYHARNENVFVLQLPDWGGWRVQICDAGGAYG